MNTRQLSAAIAMIWTIIGICWVMADSPQEDPSAKFYAPLRVPLVNVEVVVTDNDGESIMGLSERDFEVFEDGKPVAITHFASAAEQAPQSETADQRSSEAWSVPRNLFLGVFIDDSNINSRFRTAALSYLHEFLAQPLPSSIDAGLVRFDGSVHVESDFSNQTDDIVAAIERIQKLPARDPSREGESLVRRMQSAWQRPPLPVPTPRPVPGQTAGTTSPMFEGIERSFASMNADFVPELRAHSNNRYLRNRDSLRGLTEFVNYLRGIPGHKAVLWVGGFELRAGESLFRTWQDLFPREARNQHIDPFRESMRYDLTDAFRDLVEYANSHRVSFYTLDSLSAGIGISVEYSTHAFEGGGRPASSGPESAQSLREALQMMSVSTGGRVLMNNTTLGQQLEEVATELSSYYSLAYTPPSPGDGEYHEITVKVRRDGAQLRHREGYRDGGEDDRIAARTVAAATLGVAANPLGIGVECRQAEAREDELFLVPVAVRIPLGDLVLVPEAESHAAQISMFSVVRDARGGMSDVIERSYPIEIANDRLSSAVSQPVVFVLGMVLREGPHRIAVSVRDDRSSIESTGFVDVVVGAAEEGTSG